MATDQGPLPSECPHSAYMRPEWCTTCIAVAKREGRDLTVDPQPKLERPNGKP